MADVQSTRQMWKVRYNKSGEQISFDDAPPETYFDVKLTKKAKYKQGSGNAYRQTVYNYSSKPKDRIYEEDDLIIKLEGGDGGTDIIYKKRVRKQTIEAGTGRAYQKTRVTFNNLADGSRPRDVRVQRLEDDSNHIDVERIQKDTLMNRTPKFQEKRVHLINDEDVLNATENTLLLNPDGSTRPEE